MMEAALQGKIRKTLEDQGCWVLNVHGHMMQMVGVPDLLILHRDVKCFVELKVDARVRPDQKLCIRNIKRTKFPAFVLRYKNDTEIFLLTDELEQEVYAEFKGRENILKTLIDVTRKSHMKAIVDALKGCGIEPTIEDHTVRWSGGQMLFDDNEDVVLQVQ